MCPPPMQLPTFRDKHNYQRHPLFSHICVCGYFSPSQMVVYANNVLQLVIVKINNTLSRSFINVVTYFKNNSFMALSY